jgi:hypothetical protein
MLKHSLKLEPSVKINTADIYRFLNLNKEIIPDGLYNDCLSQLHEVLELNSKPEVGFSPEILSYIKGKYTQFKEYKRLHNEKSELDFFAVINNRFIFKSGTARLWANSILNIDESNVSDKNEDENVLIDTQMSDLELNKEYDIRELHRWAYDIYSYRQNCYVSTTQLRNEQELLVAFYLLFLDPEDFNYEHLASLFRVENIQGLKYKLTALKAKYSDVLNLTDWSSKLELLEFSSLANKTVDESKNNDVAKSGRKSKDFMVSGPEKVVRNSIKFKIEEEVTFFKLLQKHDIIISQENGLSNNDLSKIIACLTGVSLSGVENKFDKKPFQKAVLQKIKMEMNKFINLIGKELA